MEQDKIQAFLSRRFPNEKIKFVGAGTDSWAFRVGDQIYRFPKHGVDMYQREAAILDTIRPHITATIPDVKIMTARPYKFAVHHMVMGNKWSWHKFSWRRRRQRRLAQSYARFLAELHGVDTARLCAAVHDLAETIPYCDIHDAQVAQFLRRFMNPRQMRYFARRYDQIVNAPVDSRDMVFVHMGLKGANSVVADDGTLSGVFDFCSGGIYERGRDFVLAYLGRNRALYKGVLREYYRRTGVRINRARVADLAAIEFLWRRRIFPEGVFAPRNDHFIQKNLAVALARFHRLPGVLYWLIYLRMSLYRRRMRGRAA